MWALKSKQDTGVILYFVDYGPMGIPKMSTKICDARQFPTHQEAEDASGLCAFSFDLMEV